jgi:hypothetical protein
MLKLSDLDAVHNGIEQANIHDEGVRLLGKDVARMVGTEVPWNLKVLVVVLVRVCYGVGASEGKGVVEWGKVKVLFRESREWVTRVAVGAETDAGVYVSMANSERLSGAPLCRIGKGRGGGTEGLLAADRSDGPADENVNVVTDEFD